MPGDLARRLVARSPITREDLQAVWERSTDMDRLNRDLSRALGVR